MTALGYAIVAALGNLAGGLAVSRGTRWGLQVISGIVAFGAGFMLAVAMLEMVPHAIMLGGPGAALYLLIGYLLVHLAQHTVTPHFHFGEETHPVSRSAGVTALIGLLLHTFFDGVAIASGFLVGPALGMLLFLAIVLHKLPEGVTIASLMIAGGRPPGQAVFAAGLLGVATVAGVVFTGQVDFLVTHGLALAGGVTLYVAASNLVPEFQAKPGWALPFAFFGGAGAFYLTRELLHRVLP